jgi:hypothetical protein
MEGFLESQNDSVSNFIQWCKSRSDIFTYPPKFMLVPFGGYNSSEYTLDFLTQFDYVAPMLYAEEHSYDQDYNVHNKKDGGWNQSTIESDLNGWITVISKMKSEPKKYSSAPQLFLTMQTDAAANNLSNPSWWTSQKNTDTPNVVTYFANLLMTGLTPPPNNCNSTSCCGNSWGDANNCGGTKCTSNADCPDKQGCYADCKCQKS